MSAQALLGRSCLGLGIARHAGSRQRAVRKLSPVQHQRGNRLPVRALPPMTREAATPVIEEALPPIEQDLPFLDPFVRSFLLGLAAGGICEAAHVLFKFYGLSMHVDGDLIQALPAYLDQFSPLFIWDHIAAVGSWVLLYAIEAIAVLSVLNRYPDDQQTQMDALRSMASLPRKMLPVKLNAIKRWLYLHTSGHVDGLLNKAAAATVVAATATAATAGPMQFRDSGSATLMAPGTDVVAEINAQAAAPLGRMPTLPQVQKQSQPTSAADVAQREAARREKTNAARSDRALKPGAWDPTRTLVPPAEREALERKSYLRNFWYAAALSTSLSADKPLGVDVLGSKVVLFRDATTGDIACLDDTCVHRGAPLSGGSLTVHSGSGKTCVVCPYHGWAFDGEGHLKDVPSAEPGRWPKRPIASSHPVAEKDGFIWLYFGNNSLPEDERPPIPTAPQQLEGSWLAPSFGEVALDLGHFPVFENAIDMAHMRTVLGEAFGADAAHISAPDTAREAFGTETKYTITVPTQPTPAAAAAPAGVKRVEVTARAMLPSSVAVTMDLGGGRVVSAFINTVPVSEGRTVNRFSLQRNFSAWDGFDQWAHTAMCRMLGDDANLVGQLTPDSMAEEWAHGANAPQVAFRQLRQEWVDVGYAVLPESIKKRRGLLSKDM